MLLATLLTGLTALASAATALTWQEKCDKYKCLTLDTFKSWSPPCATPCLETYLGNSADGCPPDDFRCHCVRARSIAPVVGNCLRNSTSCFPSELSQLGMNLRETCTYFNETGYEPYRGCANLLYSFVTFADSK